MEDSNAYVEGRRTYKVRSNTEDGVIMEKFIFPYTYMYGYGGTFYFDAVSRKVVKVQTIKSVEDLPDEVADYYSSIADVIKDVVSK
jgi:hypothetical protein